MNRRAIPPASVVFCFVLLLGCACRAGDAQSQDQKAVALSRGVTAFKAGRYSDAAENFKKALALDPDCTKAEVYLGTTYAVQVVPNLNSPDNLSLAEAAIEAFKQVPDSDPEYHAVLKQLAAVYRNTGRLDEAKDAEVAALKLHSDDAETHYTVGVIDWMQAYKFSVAELSANGLQDDGRGNARMSSATCEAIKIHNAQLVDDAIAHLSRAVELNASYSDAMVYLNLVYRRKADFDCNDPSARTRDVALADKWSRSSLVVKQKSSPATAPQ